MFCFCKFGTSLHTFVIKKSLMHELCTTCLDGKIVLSKSNFRFARVSILRYKIACITSYHDVSYLTPSTRTNLDHFPGVGKMVEYLLTCILTRFLGSDKHMRIYFEFIFGEGRCFFGGSMVFFGLRVVTLHIYIYCVHHSTIDDETTDYSLSSGHCSLLVALAGRSRYKRH